eukprot:4410944-Pleurochrysis_carterae.AAC.1
MAVMFVQHPARATTRTRAEGCAREPNDDGKRTSTHAHVQAPETTVMHATATAQVTARGRTQTGGTQTRVAQQAPRA